MRNRNKTTEMKSPVDFSCLAILSFWIASWYRVSEKVMSFELLEIVVLVTCLVSGKYRYDQRY